MTDQQYITQEESEAIRKAAIDHLLTSDLVNSEVGLSEKDYQLHLLAQNTLIAIDEVARLHVKLERYRAALEEIAAVNGLEMFNAQDIAKQALEEK